MKKPVHLPKLENFTPYHPSSAALREAERRHVVLPETLSRTEQIISWICCLIAAGIMIETLFFKFTGAGESRYIFQKMGTEPWWRWGQGIWELMASICLVTPALRWAGGILTTGAMAAALLSHMTWLGYSIQGDHGLLFGMATVTFLCGSTVLIVHRHAIPFVTPLSRW